MDATPGESQPPQVAVRTRAKASAAIKANGTAAENSAQAPPLPALGKG